MTQRASLDAVTAWIDAHVAPLAPEPVARADAIGRVTATDVVAPAALPARDAAALDGIALRAAETVGASAYNPLSFPLVAGAALPPGGAARVAAGDPLPTGADSVVALDRIEITASSCALVEPADPGGGVDRAGAHVAANGVLIRAGRRVTPSALAMLALSGIDPLAVIRRPRVRVLMARDGANRALLAASIARDGGMPDGGVPDGVVLVGDRAALAAALGAADVDLVLTVGGTGPGAHDHAAAALADAGSVAFHGVAIRQCETAGLGRTARGTVVALLPGAPAACLWAYELIAGPMVRRLGGRPIGLPYEARRMTTATKIVSGIGMVDICPVARRGDGMVEPIASFTEAGLGAALRADGVVIVPAGSEGHARDSEVLVYLFEA